MAHIRQARPDSYGTYKTVKARFMWHLYDSQGHVYVAHIRQSRPDSYGKYKTVKARIIWHI